MAKRPAVRTAQRYGLLIYIATFGQLTPAAVPEKCDAGYVWREAFSGDYACVTTETREQAQQDNAAAASRYLLGADAGACKAPFVWRNALAGDNVCVSVAARDQARGENRLSGQRTSVFSSGPNSPRQCLPGFVWRQATPGDHVCVEPEARNRVRAENARASQTRGSNACKPGYVWRQAGPSDYVCVAPEVREQTRRDNASYQTGERTLRVACDKYAREAVEQYFEMRANDCGFSGPRWQANYGKHNEWCQNADPRDRGGEWGARSRQLRDCSARSVGQVAPIPGEQCVVSVRITNRSCITPDGTQSMPPGGSTAPGCGGSLENARLRALVNFAATFGCISDGDVPEPGCCTIREDVVQGCLCN